MQYLEGSSFQLKFFVLGCPPASSLQSGVFELGPLSTVDVILPFIGP